MISQGEGRTIKIIMKRRNSTRIGSKSEIEARHRSESIILGIWICKAPTIMIMLIRKVNCLK
jgi:hypothetical protein